MPGPAYDPAHIEYVLRLGDNALILGQRLSEWCGHSAFVEEDVAMANIALDHIGRARTLFTLACDLEGRGRTEDDLAYGRGADAFKNFWICELPIGDFAFTIVRQVLFDTYHFHLYEQLQQSSDRKLAAIAAKVIKESTYHLRHCSQWLIRLGDGTDESHRRAQDALNEQWCFTGELFAADAIDEFALAADIGPDITDLRQRWRAEIADILRNARLKQPDDAPIEAGGRQGLHTDHMGGLLARMQSVQRAYPGLEW